MSQDTYTIPEGVRRIRADKALAGAFPEHSRTAWQRAFDAGLVRRGDTVLDRSAEVRGGDVLTYELPAVEASVLRAVDIPLNVLFEDKHLLVINKATGMVVHPGAGTAEDTLVHALLAHCEGSLSGIGGVERPGIVHRLDRETTGLMVVAKTDAAHRGLSEQFEARSLQKEYVTLVTGVPRLLSGTIDRPISRHPQHRHRMTVGEDDSGKPARTDWKVEEAFPPLATLLRCQLHTGRTHQIRVHLKSLGHPLLGDATYGWKHNPKIPVEPQRVMLHAERLAFQHPVTFRQIDLRAPLPADFLTMLKALRSL